MEKRAELLSARFLNNNHVVYEIEELEDRDYDPKGWQYKRYGNSTKGKDKLAYLKKNMQLVADNSQSAKNDSDPRYYENLVFMDDRCVIEVQTKPARSGKTCKYSFFKVTTM
jgi:hypothetical protein